MAAGICTWSRWLSGFGGAASSSDQGSFETLTHCAERGETRLGNRRSALIPLRPSGYASGEPNPSFTSLALFPDSRGVC
jgi:hypothetical protein